MVIDTSAILSIFLGESDAAAYARALEDASILKMAAPTYFETCLVLTVKRGPAALPKLELMLQAANVDVVPFTKGAARLASEAFIRFGKGRHPAALNFGDCISYAVAKTELMPLLFKGGDFRLTDVEAVV